jgi:hypothetical protein
MNHWRNDKNLIDELNKRSADLKSGKDKGIGWEELKKEIKRSTKHNTLALRIK